MAVIGTTGPLPRKIRSKALKALLTVVMAIVVGAFVFPIGVTAINSLKTPDAIQSELSPAIGKPDDGKQAPPADRDEYVPLSLIPPQATLNAYYDILLAEPQFLSLFWNSMKLTIPIVAGQLVVSVLAGYAFALLRYRWREPLFFAYIVVMLMPFQVTLVPNYIIMNMLGLMNSNWSIVLPGIFGAFGVFLIRQFMQVVPYSYLEAARIDGAGHMRILLTIVLPMCRSGLAALVVLAFIDNWNMVEQPLIFLKEASRQPLSVYMAYINKDDVGLAFAASVVYMLPAILLTLHTEKELVEGVQLSGIKG